ncbi:MAG TPA: alpha/beta hydrolase [Candidatus Dormibacteraeota bacterium]|jgi:pimeloyl-ACP methyl ester carboxylesterase|nr:alpha/beta hydrolase [Candidatus Dormibacteraeota bacterium]
MEVAQVGWRMVAAQNGSYLEIGKGRVFYEMSGSGESLLLLHGGFGTNEDFADQAPEFVKHFRVVAFERSGHGHSADTDQEFSFDQMAADTITLIEKLNLGPVNIVGWSDGAVVAFLVAISRPDLVKRIVSVGGLFNTSSLTPQDVAWLRGATPESFRKAEPSIVARYERVSPDGPEHFPIVFKKTIRMWLNEPNISKEDLAKIAAPTLIMAGDRDATTHEHTLELFRSIKNAELCIVPGASHFLLSEKSEFANRVILDFLLKK